MMEENPADMVIPADGGKAGKSNTLIMAPKPF